MSGAGHNKGAGKRHKYGEGFYTAAEIAEIKGVDRSLIDRRIRQGIPVDGTGESAPLYKYGDEILTVSRISELSGLSIRAINQRLASGYPPGDRYGEAFWGGRYSTSKTKDERKRERAAPAGWGG